MDVLTGGQQKGHSRHRRDVCLCFRLDILITLMNNKSQKKPNVAIFIYQNIHSGHNMTCLITKKQKGHTPKRKA